MMWDCCLKCCSDSLALWDDSSQKLDDLFIYLHILSQIYWYQQTCWTVSIQRLFSNVKCPAQCITEYSCCNKKTQKLTSQGKRPSRLRLWGWGVFSCWDYIKIYILTKFSWRLFRWFYYVARSLSPTGGFLGVMQMVAPLVTSALCSIRGDSNSHILTEIQIMTFYSFSSWIFSLHMRSGSSNRYVLLWHEFKESYVVGEGWKCQHLAGVAPSQSARLRVCIWGRHCGILCLWIRRLRLSNTC